MSLTSLLWLVLFLAPLLLGIVVSDRLAVLRLWAIYSAAFVVFVVARSFADQLYVMPFYSYPVAMDRLLGFGTLPTVRMQHALYTPGAFHWWDRLCVFVYGSHFVNMWVLCIVLTLRKSRGLAPFVLANALLYLVALVVHFVVPTVPPWLASEYGVEPKVARLLLDLGRGLSPELYRVGLDVSGNDVAAMPSVHIGVTYLIVRAARTLGTAIFGLALLYALVMFWAVIYGGEHYVVDAVAGAILAELCWRLVRGLSLTSLADRTAAMDAAVQTASRG